MMAIVYDLGPDQCDLSSNVLRRKLGRETALYLAQFQAKLRDEFIALGQSAEFSIGIGYKLALTKKPGEGDIILTKGEMGQTVGIVEVPKDPSSTHPYRCTELVKQVNAVLQGEARITSYDITSIVKAHGIKQRTEYYYQGRVAGSPIQYSQSFFEWIVKQYHNDPAFFGKAKERLKQLATQPFEQSGAHMLPNRNSAVVEADVEQQAPLNTGLSRNVPLSADVGR
jgi:hypothetical protein